MGQLEELRARGIVHHVSDPALGELLDGGRASFYIGYDPSAKSLQLGNLFAVVTMRRLQTMGHRPVVLVGGATGMIGDPSGRSSERNLLDEETLAANIAGIRAQLERMLEFGSGPGDAVLVNNRDWLGPITFLDFLRDVGRRFRVSEMLAKESVKRRLEAEDGISFTEFTYQMLQAHDFYHLYTTMGVRLQAGGGDQWGNIAAGIDYVRKRDGAQVFGLCIPLVTDGQGQKFGKSLGGAVYLDAGMTSPYKMYQFLLNSEDAKVGEYLKFFTFLSLGDIADLEAATARDPGARLAQKTLAEHVVRFVHGDAGVAAAERATRIFFGEAIENLSPADVEAIFGDVPSVTLAPEVLAAGVPAADLLALTPLFSGKNDARRAIEQKGAYLNNKPLDDPKRVLGDADCAAPGVFVVRKGKKNYAMVRVGRA